MTAAATPAIPERISDPRVTADPAIPPGPPNLSEAQHELRLSRAALAAAALVALAVPSAAQGTIRIGARIDRSTTIPPPLATGLGGDVLGATYDFSSRQLRVGAISTGFDATRATLLEVLQTGGLGNTIAQFSPAAGFAGGFQFAINLTTAQEILLLNRRLYLELSASSGRVGGRLERTNNVLFEASGSSPNGETFSWRTKLQAPIGELLVSGFSDGGSPGVVPTSARIRLGDPTTPGAIVEEIDDVDLEDLNYSFALTQEQLDFLQNGPSFVEVDYSSGTTLEGIQAALDSKMSFADGNQAGTASASTAKAWFEYSPTETLPVRYVGEAFGLSNVTSVELRQGFFGQTGNLIASLTPLDGSTRVEGSFVPTPTQLAFLRQGQTYVVWKTAAFPNGEIRGQAFFPAFAPTFDGTACVGSNGDRPYLDAPATLLGLGTDATFSITRGLPNAPCWMLLGVDAPRTTPWNLGVLGMPRCFMFLDPVAAIAGTTNGDGSTRFTFAIPATDGQGLLTAQAGLLDAAANPLGFTMTNGLFSPVN